jgi:hypothetical protein
MPSSSITASLPAIRTARDERFVERQSLLDRTVEFEMPLLENAYPPADLAY